MVAPEHFPIGIEEEYLLVDPETRALAATQPPEFMARCQQRLGPRVTHEFLQAQVEIGTSVCTTVTEARAEIAELRAAVAETAEAFGMRMVAASTHPWADWREQVPVDKARYRLLTAENQSLSRRMAVSGMHVHAGIEDPDLRIDLMGQVTYFLPHLLALTASSPFWQGQDTGLKAFRPIIGGDLPRSGLPESFERWSDWLEMLEMLAETGMLTDPSKIWWDLRPSAKHPTLELRVCDVATWWEDALTVAALYQALLAMLAELRARNQRWRSYRRLLVLENKWLAQRYGVGAVLADFGRRRAVPFVDLVDELVELVAPQADALGCRAEVERARAIARRGTSADHQLRVWHAALDAGATEREAQQEVVDWLIVQSVRAEPPADTPAAHEPLEREPAS
jgi:carboxylate-amine ligase